MCCIPHYIWIDWLNSKADASKIIIGFIWTKYDANLRD